MRFYVRASYIACIEAGLEYVRRGRQSEIIDKGRRRYCGRYDPNGTRHKRGSRYVLRGLGVTLW